MTSAEERSTQCRSSTRSANGQRCGDDPAEFERADADREPVGLDTGTDRQGRLDRGGERRGQGVSELGERPEQVTERGEAEFGFRLDAGGRHHDEVVGGAVGGPQQRCLADARFAAQQQRRPVRSASVVEELGDPRHLDVAADERGAAGRVRVARFGNGRDGRRAEALVEHRRLQLA